jgi:hypothetical protein
VYLVYAISQNGVNFINVFKQNGELFLSSFELVAAFALLLFSYSLLVLFWFSCEF